MLTRIYTKVRGINMIYMNNNNLQKQQNNINFSTSIYFPRISSQQSVIIDKNAQTSIHYTHTL